MVFSFLQRKLINADINCCITMIHSTLRIPLDACLQPMTSTRGNRRHRTRCLLFRRMRRASRWITATALTRRRAGRVVMGTREICAGKTWGAAAAYHRSSSVWITARVICMDEELAPAANQPQTVIIGARRMPDTKALDEGDWGTI